MPYGCAGDHPDHRCQGRYPGQERGPDQRGQRLAVMVAAAARKYLGLFLGASRAAFSAGIGQRQCAAASASAPGRPGGEFHIPIVAYASDRTVPSDT